MTYVMSIQNEWCDRVDKLTQTGQLLLINKNLICGMRRTWCTWLIITCISHMTRFTVTFIICWTRTALGAITSIHTLNTTAKMKKKAKDQSQSTFWCSNFLSSIMSYICSRYIRTQNTFNARWLLVKCWIIFFPLKNSHLYLSAHSFPHVIFISLINKVIKQHKNRIGKVWKKNPQMNLNCKLLSLSFMFNDQICVY